MIKRSEFSFGGYEKIASSSVFSYQKQATNNRSDTELSKLDKSIDSITSTKIKVILMRVLLKIKYILKITQVGSI